MELKKINWRWSLLVGAAVFVLMELVFNARFGKWMLPGAGTPTWNLLMPFISGVAGGWILIFFLNRAQYGLTRRIIWAAFILTLPLVLIAIIGGGLFGPLGALLVPALVWAAVCWLASVAGNFFAKRSQA